MFKNLLAYFLVMSLMSSSFWGCSTVGRLVGLSGPEEAPDPNDSEAWSEWENRQLSYGLNHRNLTLGMSSKQVLSIWGEPQDIEKAGTGSYGAERWLYSEGIHANLGLSKTRVIYFDKFRVIGWETH